MTLRLQLCLGPGPVHPNPSRLLPQQSMCSQPLDVCSVLSISISSTQLKLAIDVPFCVTYIMRVLVTNNTITDTYSCLELVEELPQLTVQEDYTDGVLIQCLNGSNQTFIHVEASENLLQACMADIPALLYLELYLIKIKVTGSPNEGRYTCRVPQEAHRLKTYTLLWSQWAF